MNTNGNLYLIAHKVRGEAAFDIAIKMPMPDSDWWIIPTSGHRAYPFWRGSSLDHAVDMGVLDTMPADWPDHYPTPSMAQLISKSEGKLQCPSPSSI